MLSLKKNQLRFTNNLINKKKNPALFTLKTVQLKGFKYYRQTVYFSAESRAEGQHAPSVLKRI